MKKTTLSSFFLVAATAVTLAAQTTPQTTTTSAHRTTATTTTHRSASGCVTPAPALSPKIPALPASAPCVKTLYTVTRIPTTKLDYGSPLLSPEVREELGGGPATYSLDYVDTEVGTGEVAKAGKWLTVRYTGYLVDGKKFDSSYDHPGGEPISFPYGMHQVIPGWDTGFEGMHIGGKRRLFIPYELAYGEQGRQNAIPPKAMLIFDVELVAQSDTRPVPPATARPPVPGRQGVPPGGTQPPAKTPPPAGATPPGGSTPPSTPPQGSSSATKPQR